jgi:hypothetical protein
MGALKQNRGVLWVFFYRRKGLVLGFFYREKGGRVSGSVGGE